MERPLKVNLKNIKHDYMDKYLQKNFILKGAWIKDDKPYELDLSLRDVQSIVENKDFPKEIIINSLEAVPGSDRSMLSYPEINSLLDYIEKQNQEIDID